MDPILSSAAAGLRSRIESLNMLSNNLANASTDGYKADRELYGVYSGTEEQSFEAILPDLQGQWTDFSQGLIQETGVPLDMALSGAGFFQAKGPSGLLYTRSGHFHLDTKGRLVTRDGYAVHNVKGEEIVLQHDQPTEVTADGEIRQNGQVKGKLQLADFRSGGLSKVGSSYFQYSGPKEGQQAAGAQVLQGRIEAANVGVAESAVRLVNVMRQFEMLQKAVSVTSEAGRKSLEDLARVGS